MVQVDRLVAAVVACEKSLARPESITMIRGMEALGALAMWAGFLLMLVGGILFIVAAFRESILWGLAVLFLPGVVALVFLILKWSRAKDSFFLQLYGLILFVIAVVALSAHVPFRHHW
ncbi:MAG: hypothetical protein JWO36_5635 [Myxococcales bacterium]|nr:hypothetical protein [Myxococcales bacterium]